LSSIQEKPVILVAPRPLDTPLNEAVVRLLQYHIQRRRLVSDATNSSNNVLDWVPFQRLHASATFTGERRSLTLPLFLFLPSITLYVSSYLSY